MSNVIPFPSIRRFPSSAAAHNRKAELVAALQDMQDLRIKGYEVEQGQLNCVVVTRNGHVQGLWHYNEGTYHYTPTSYGQPTFTTGSLTLVMQHMRALLIPASVDFSPYNGRERRRNERYRVNWWCLLCSTTEPQNVRVEDVSAGGLGIDAALDILEGDLLRVEIRGGFHLIGRVARVHDGKLGFAHRYPLRPSDPLLMAARASLR